MAMLMQRDWGNPILNALADPGQILGMTGGGVNPFVVAGVIPKTGITLGTKLAVGAGLGAGAGLLYLAGKGGIGQTSSQVANPSVPTNYNFYQVPGGGTQNITNPKGGTATTTQTSDQKATSISSDFLIIAIVAIGALMLFTGKR